MGDNKFNYKHGWCGSCRHSVPVSGCFGPSLSFFLRRRTTLRGSAVLAAAVLGAFAAVGVAGVGDADTSGSAWTSSWADAFSGELLAGADSASIMKIIFVCKVNKQTNKCDAEMTTTMNRNAARTEAPL